MILLNYDLTKITDLGLYFLPEKIPVVIVLDESKFLPPKDIGVKPSAYQVLSENQIRTTVFKEFLANTGFSIKRTANILPIIALDLRKADIKTLSKLNEIKEIWYDFKVKAVLEDSNQVEEIQQLRNNFKVTGKGNIAYVLDTGMDLTHPNLTHSILGKIDLVNEKQFLDPAKTNHASHVAGIIASDHSKYNGIAPGTKIFSVKILDNDGSGEMSTIINGIESVITEGPGLINLSVGGINPLCFGNCPVCSAINKAAEFNIISIVAAGNSGPLPYTLTCPGKAEKSITIAAIDNNKNLAIWSSRSGLGQVNKPDLAAIGVDITSCSGNGDFITLSGTSMATPRVTGFISLLKEYWKNKGLDENKFNSDLAKEILKKASVSGLIYNSGDGNIVIQKCFEIINSMAGDNS